MKHDKEYEEALAEAKTNYEDVLNRGNAAVCELDWEEMKKSFFLLKK